ncbi:MAG: hypothetical protein IE925_16015 [Rhodobacterales bacterium]|nr:hypothetical protein [Rhodobacterales bacterium]
MFWPLIWVQVLLLRAAVRASYGKGVQYHWSVTSNGRVFLTSIDWMPGQKKERTFPKPANDRLAAACDGRAFTPAYSTLCAEPYDAVNAAVARPSAQASTLNLPLPET